MSEEEKKPSFAEYVDRMAADQAAAIAAAGVPTEKQMRDAEVPWPDTAEELSAYVTALVDRPHDYGTCVYAMSMAAVAAFNYVARKLGVTGFQSSCADLDVLRRTRGFEWGKLLNYDNLLYPQYANSEDHFPAASTLLEENRVELAKRAAEKLKDPESGSPEVRAWWSRLVEAGKD